jgi:plasmid stability protein
MQSMKNITLSVDDDTYRLARIKAAEREQSVSAMVRDLIRGLAAKPADDLAAKNARLLAALAVSKNFSASERLTREEIYDRSRRD